MKRAFASLFVATSAALTLGCGESQGRVLERSPVIDSNQRPGPPGSNLRMDVLMVRSAESCAIGQRCREDGERGNCFELFHDPRVEYRPETIDFVPPGDPRIGDAEQSTCFRLALNGDAVSALSEAFAELRNQVYELSQGEIDLDIRLHDIPTVGAGFKPENPWHGLFLAPEALNGVGLGLVSRDTDFVFAVTGPSDINDSNVPVMERCVVTQRELDFGGATYTWITPGCTDDTTLLRHLFYQIYIGLERFNAFDDLYDGRYPNRCGDGSEDPALWFPLLEDCRADPDSPSCGRPECDEHEFAGHVLTDHWPRGRGYIGNHCRNGLEDADETGVDSGGVCAGLGR